MTNEDRTSILRAVMRLLDKAEDTTGNATTIGCYITFDDKDQNDSVVWEYGGPDFQKRDDLLVVVKHYLPEDVWNKLNRVMREGDNWDLL